MRYSTYEPLHIIEVYYSVTYTVYGKDNNLLEEPGWKQFKLITKTKKMLLHFFYSSKASIL